MNESIPPDKKNTYYPTGDVLNGGILNTSAPDTDIIFNLPDLCGLTISMHYFPQHFGTEQEKTRRTLDTSE